jgi:hypothetical protein
VLFVLCAGETEPDLGNFACAVGSSPVDLARARAEFVGFGEVFEVRAVNDEKREEILLGGLCAIAMPR